MSACLDSYQTEPPERLTKKFLIDMGANFNTTFFNDAYMFLVSTSGQIASTNFKEMMWTLYQKTTPRISQHTGYDDDVFVLEKLREKEFNDRIEDMDFKAIFVRNPVSRLLAAYRSKVLIEGKVKPGYATFAEFVEYVVDRNDESNPNWQPIFRRLRPCFIQYNFIGKLETIEPDLQLMFKTLDIDKVISFGKAKPHVNSGNLTLVRKHYGTLSSEVFKRFIRMYEGDFRVFGYRVPNNQTDFRSMHDLAGL